jgi:hypothetical protein
MEGADMKAKKRASAARSRSGKAPPTPPARQPVGDEALRDVSGGRKAGHGQQEFLRVRLDEVFVTSVNTSKS